MLTVVKLVRKESPSAVGIDVAQRSLADGAGRALRELAGQARNEIGAQGASTTVLRVDVAHRGRSGQGLI